MKPRPKGEPMKHVPLCRCVHHRSSESHNAVLRIYCHSRFIEGLTGVLCYDNFEVNPEKWGRRSRMKAGLPVANILCRHTPFANRVRRACPVVLRVRIWVSLCEQGSKALWLELLEIQRGSPCITGRNDFRECLLRRRFSAARSWCSLLLRRPC